MSKNEPRVTGVGGIFFKTENPDKTKKWYQDNLGLKTDKWGTNIMDNEGNKIELWEPNDVEYEKLVEDRTK